MSNNIVGLMFGVGFAGWVYVQMRRRSASTKSVWVVTILAGLVGFFVIATSIGLFTPDN